MSASRRALLSLVCALSLAAASLLGCSGTNHQTKDSSKLTASEQRDAVDPEVVRYAFDGRVPMVVKFNMASFDELSPALDTFIDSQFVRSKRDRRTAAMFRKLGPLMLMSQLVPIERHLDRLDGGRAVYITREVLADDSFFTALRYGAMLQPDEVAPTGIHTRFLLPTDDPRGLADAIGAVHGKHRDDMQAVVTAAERFVVVDLVEFRPSVDQEQVMAHAVVDLERTAGAVRTTPALLRLHQTDAPLSVYFRSEDLRLDTGAAMMLEAVEALAYAIPENRAQMLARGVAGGLSGMLLAPVSELDQEDTVIEARGDGDSGVVFDAMGTLTERGREVAEAATGAARSIEAAPSGKRESAAQNARAFASAQWSYDAAQTATEVPSAFWNQMNQSRRGGVGIGDVTEMLRSGGWRAYAHLLFGSPTFWLRGAVASLPPDLSSLLPQAGAFELELTGAVLSPEHLALTGAMLFGSEQAEPAAQPYLAQLRQMIAGVSGAEPSIAFVDTAGDEAARLEVRAGPGAAQRPSRDVELVAGAVAAEIDFTPFLALQGQAGLAEELGTLTKMQMLWRQEPTVNRMRVHFGEGTRELPAVPEVAGFEPAQAGPLCADALVEATWQTLGTLEQLSPSASAELMLARLNLYDDQARTCAERRPERKDDLKLARARMRSLLRMRWMYTDDASTEAVIKKSACELGDEVQCE